MDIFVRNIPEQASNKNLQTFFREHFRPFGIDDFHCQKLRSRGCATVTVLDEQKAQRFLKVYGNSQSHDSHTNTKKLRYMDKDLFCVPSKSKCNETLLQTLRKDAKDRGDPTSRKQPATTTAARIDRSFDYISIQCGHWDYQAQDLIFVSQAMDQETGSIKFGKRSVALVSQADGTGMGKYRLDAPYSSILSISTGSLQDVTFTLCESPRIYQDPTSDHSLHSSLAALSLYQRAPIKPKRRRVTSFAGIDGSIISSCFVYRILMSNPAQFRRICQLLQHAQELPRGISWPAAAITPRTTYATDMGRLTSALCNQYMLLDFDVQFQTQRLAQNGYLTPGRLLELLPCILQVFDRSGASTCAEAVRKLSRKLPHSGPETEGNVFAIERLRELLIENEEAIQNQLCLGFSIEQQHSHIGLVHKAIVTPTGVYLEGPEPETTNRVLRTYSDHADYFLRVTFCEEDGERLNFDRFVSLEEIFHKKFKSVLDGVITIARRRFESLGFSHSSLRDQTCWFMAPFIHEGVLLNAAAVVAKLGDFSAIRSPAKCAARIGQAFSTTDGAVKIPSAIVGHIPDVKRNGRVFSDGVGTISSKILAKLWKDYAPAKDTRPTLYQIRYAGTCCMLLFLVNWSLSLS